MQPHPLTRAFSGGERQSVVDDFKNESLRIPYQRHTDGIRAGVPGRIGDQLLRDAVEVGGRVGI